VPDPFLDTLSAVRRERQSFDAPAEDDPFTTALADVRAGTQADTRSTFARAVDWSTTPLVPQLARGARAIAESIDQPRPDLQPGGFVESLKAAASAIPDVARNLWREPVATLRGGLAGAIEGAGDVASQFTAPLDASLLLLGGAGRAARGMATPALEAIQGAERAIVGARQAGNLEDAAHLARELNAARESYGRASAVARGAGGLEVAGSAGLAGRGVERIADAQSPAEFATGLAELAGGVAGVSGGRGALAAVPDVPASQPIIRGFLRPRPTFQATATGDVMPYGTAVPVSAAGSDPSFVRGISAEYARREPVALLPEARTSYVADEAGRVAALEHADQLASSPALQRADTSEVRSVPAAIADREFDGRTVTRRVFSGDPSATDAPLVDLTDADRRELRRMAEELSTFHFTRRSFKPVPRGRGNAYEVLAGAGGAPVYHDILAPGGSATRAEVEAAINRLLRGEHSAIGQRALDVARLRQAGSRDVSKPMLPENWDERLPDDALAPEPARGVASLDDEAGFDAFAAALENLRAGGGSFGPGELGGARTELLMRAGSGLAGAAYGGATGETPEDRVQRAAAFGVGGALAPSLLSPGGRLAIRARPRADADGSAGVAGAGAPQTAGNVRVPLRARQGATFQPSPVSPMARAGEIPAARRLAFPSLEKQPAEVRDEIVSLLEKHGGFTEQRRGVQSIARTEARAERIAVPLERVLPPGRALNAEELAAYKNAVATVMSQRQPLVDKITRGAATDLEKLEFDRLTQESIVLLQSYRGAKAEAGRALNILRSQARILETGDQRFIEAALKVPGFDERTKAIAEAVKAAGNDPVKQLEALRSLAVPSKFQLAQAAYYNSLLSGVKTQLRNFIGNSFNLVANLLQPVAGGPVDAVRAAVTGQARQVYLGELPHGAVGAFSGMPRGFQRALFTLRRGFTPAAVEFAAAGKFDAPRVELPGGLLTNAPSRLLEAADQFFRTIGHEVELHAGAYALARQEGTRGPALHARMAELMTGHSPEAIALRERAETFAARSVFQEQSGPIVQKLLALKSDPKVSPVARAALTFVFPFVRTPMNILRQGAEWSPAGLALSGAHRGGRESAQALGRAAFGSAMLLPLAYLAATGRLSGFGTTNAVDRATDMERGWRPNSVKVGDAWVEYNLAQPFGVAASAVANGWERFREAGGSDAAADEAFASVLAGVGASFLDQSFLSSLNDVVSAVNDPERSGKRVAQSLAQSLVPASGLLRNVTQAIDPVVRQPEGAVESAMTIIPGLSSQVPSRVGRYGEDVTRPGGPLRRGFVVPGISEDVSDPVDGELRRLGVRVGLPSDRLTVPGVTGLERDDKRAIKVTRGQAVRQELERVIQSPGYANLPDEIRAKALQRAIDRARDRASDRARGRIRARFISQQPVGVQP
jgi:hypothetical protein